MLKLQMCVGSPIAEYFRAEIIFHYATATLTEATFNFAGLVSVLIERISVYAEKFARFIDGVAT